MHSPNTSNDQQLPMVSVITVVFNRAQDLLKTIQCVNQQTYRNIEFIVIDGGSTDGTIETIRKNDGRIAHWITEPDKGIYDAMNKGARVAKGDWVCFMNAGDVFYDRETLSKIFGQEKLKDKDIVYGDSQMLYPNGYRRFIKAKPVLALKKGMICCHQSIFARRSLLMQHPFNLSNPIAADYEFLYKSHKAGCGFGYAPIPVSTVTSGGVSYQDGYKIVLAWKQVVAMLEGKRLGDTMYFGTLALYHRMRKVAKLALSQKLIDKIIRIKAKLSHDNAQ